MFAGRPISPDQAFFAALKAARQDPPRGQSTIGKGAIDQALRELELPGATPSDRASVVRRFLDSQDATSLSPKARDTLLDFVQRQSAPITGERSTEVRRRAPARTTAGNALKKQAHSQVTKLLKQGCSPEEAAERQAVVSAWLDDAEVDLAKAGARLAALATGGKLKLAGAAALAQQQAQNELAALLGGSKRGPLRQGDVETVHQWLAWPMPGQARADQAPLTHQAGNSAADAATGAAADVATDVTAVFTAVLDPARREALVRTFDALDRAGTLSWTPGGVLQHHQGVRFAQVKLRAERHPDGFAFTAFIPVGSQVLGRPGKDPNRVSEFFVERSGGFAGMTFSVGPLRP